MFQTKICGVTQAADAMAAVECGADAIGLNFYEPSSRYVTFDQAEAIVSSLRSSTANRACELVGVFVNADADQIHRTAHPLNLNWIQLHGDEPPEFLAGLAIDLQVLRAVRIGADGIAPLIKYLDECGQLGRLPDAVLLDAAAPGSYGGTGHPLDWSALASIRSELGDLPWILAGGLTPANVGEAILVGKPNGVDVASGVESAPGVKDKAKMRSFISAAKHALSEIGL